MEFHQPGLIFFLYSRTINILFNLLTGLNFLLVTAEGEGSFKDLEASRNEPCAIVPPVTPYRTDLGGQFGVTFELEGGLVVPRLCRASPEQGGLFCQDYNASERRFDGSILYPGEARSDVASVGIADSTNWITGGRFWQLDGSYQVTKTTMIMDSGAVSLIRTVN